MSSMPECENCELLALSIEGIKRQERDRIVDKLLESFQNDMCPYPPDEPCRNMEMDCVACFREFFESFRKESKQEKKLVYSRTVERPRFPCITRRELAYNDISNDDNSFTRLGIPVEIGDEIRIYRKGDPDGRD